jgi:hypothetical protein
MTEKDSKIALWMFLMLIGSIVIMMVQVGIVFSYDQDAKDEVETKGVVVQDEIPTMTISDFQNQTNESEFLNNGFGFMNFSIGDKVYLVGNLTVCNTNSIGISGMGFSNVMGLDMSIGHQVKALCMVVPRNDGQERLHLISIELV